MRRNRATVGWLAIAVAAFGLVGCAEDSSPTQPGALSLSWAPGPVVSCDEAQLEQVEVQMRIKGTVETMHSFRCDTRSAFIDAVDPEYVIISASTRHHLPRPSVVDRYENASRVILRTDVDRAKNNDHVFCTRSTFGEIDCNYKDQFEQ